ncbi:uncharacterized protein LOC144666662 [Oculina patagonica]
MEVDPNESDVSQLSEVNVTLAEDVQGLFNASGSPIRANSRTQSMGLRTEAVTASAQPSTSQNINRVVCKCKNTCSRRKSARYEGCPCLNVNLKCCGHCKCGTKKAACKNRAEDGQVIANPSAFARNRRALEESEIEIKEFVSKMSADDKDKLLIRLLSQGRGSIEFAKNMLTEGLFRLRPTALWNAKCHPTYKRVFK